MYIKLASLAFVYGAFAHVLPREPAGCCFQLKASGGQHGTIGQLSDGQNRIGGGLSPATYCIDNGGLTDSSGRGCILTPPTTQFQCDQGAKPTTGFAITDKGELQHSGSGMFYACPASDGVYNIYTEPVKNQPKCVEIKLSTSQGKCAAPAPAKSSPAPKPAAPKPSGCPTSLSGPFQFPHLIVPVSSTHPDQAYGTSYFGQINTTTSSIFNFDFPPSYQGKKCSLVFLFPQKQDLQTSSYEYNSMGELAFSELESTASQKTTWKNAPKVKKALGSFSLRAGSDISVATFDCPAGTAQSFEVSSSGGLSLEFFEDYNPSPLGLYVTAC